MSRVRAWTSAGAGVTGLAAVAVIVAPAVAMASRKAAVAVVRVMRVLLMGRMARMRRSGSQNRWARGQIDDLDVRGLEPSAEERRANARESFCAVRREQPHPSSARGCTRELCGIERAPERIRGRCRGINDGYARSQHAGNERCKHREVRAAEE